MLMQLNELLSGLAITASGGDWSTEIDSIVYDSRKARQGSLFVCIEGYVTDGHQYIGQALAQGVSAILLRKPAAGLAVPWAQVDDTRIGLAHVSDRFFGHPSGRLDLIGVTGTKGKTTATFMTRAILARAGRKSGLIGTIANYIGDEMTYASRTTPESFDLQALLDEMVKQSVASCVMEVSSQGLMLNRVYGCEFTTAVFTNLYHDHIGPSEHASMEEYLAAKLLLFRHCRQAVINRDIPVYEQVRAAVPGPCLTYGFTGEADIQASNLANTTLNQRVGTQFTLRSPWYTGEFFVGMPGRFNVYNALVAIACAGLSGAPAEAVRDGLADISVPGRAQPIPTGRPFQVIVDYAHNAASLESLLVTLREYVSGRLIVLFGNGGDRARSRRFEMGEVAGRLADLTVITSDNPRTEDPLAIIGDIITGITPTGGLHIVVADRREAIFQAVRLAQPGDMVVIAGKGHENYQIFKDRVIHFDDAEVAAEAIASLDPAMAAEADGKPAEGTSHA
jgi:UDP-N-acetylmuramoyl-L-alanyl-D-glutamate--2,6-diaminopimelate ligase